MDDQTWLDRARAGDARAFERLLARHERMLYAIARQNVPTDDDALDACQDAAVRAWRAIARFEGSPAHLARWLARIVLNAARDRGRAAARAAAFGDDGSPGSAIERVLDPGLSPEALAAAGEVADAVGRAVALLPADQREALALARIGMRYAEIADVLDVAEGTVKSRIARARVALRHALSGEAAMEPFDGLRRYQGEP